MTSVRFISPVASCVQAPMKLGSLLEQDLEGIWVHNELLNYVRNRKALKGSCKTCAHGNLCGGCRYTAYIADGDWLGPDVPCPFGPRILNARRTCLSNDAPSSRI
jgi:radical SAM protein with 4Fe4S-binding SPASM domain